MKFITLLSSFAIVSMLLIQAYLVFSYDRSVNHFASKEVKTSIDEDTRDEDNYVRIDSAHQKSISINQLEAQCNANTHYPELWMVGLLATSLLLSLFCIYTLWSLYGSLSRQKELIVLKDEFFEHIAHELKRPVNSLVMAIDGLSKESTDAKPTFKERCLSISKEAVNEIAGKIKMIMTLSMSKEGMFQLHVTEFDIKQVVDDLITIFTFNSQKTVHIELHASQDKWIVRGDKEHLTQAIANLIDNAIKYSNDTVQITLTLEKRDNNICISVSDNGLGIAPQKVETVFDKYCRAHVDLHHLSGSGIGLSYVKTVVTQHHGTIEVVSALDKGSTFTLSLPIN